MSIINVILSGGVGSRLWPLSRKSRPKQYIPLFDNQTLFGICVSRNAKVSDKIAVVGSIDNYKLSREDFERCGISDFTEIIEAAPRNTAASIAFAAFAASPEDVLFVTPSDHIIEGKESYARAIQQAVDLAKQGYIVTFGAIPTRPETGYGYIEHDAAYNVLSFKEKPNLENAAQYVASGQYLWNSGMFCFTAATYLEELNRYAPEIYDTAKAAYAKIDSGFLPSKETMEIPSVSVDYAVMEHSEKIKVVPFDFNWNDLGSFESIWDYLENDPGYTNEKNLSLGTTKHIEFVGVEGLIYVETPDAILIIPRNETQKVKAVYERLEKEKPELLQ